MVSDKSTLVEYAGKPLESKKRYFWKVRVWDENDKSSDWSKVGFWEMGLLSPEDWKGKWISRRLQDEGYLKNTKQSYAHELLPAHTIGQSFTMNGKFSMVSARIPTWMTNDSSFYLTLYYDGPKGKKIKSEKMLNVADNSWLYLFLDEPLPAGKYYLEASLPKGRIGWWSHKDDVMEGGEAYVDGKVVMGDRTIFAGISANQQSILMRREFYVNKPVRKARLYTTALGLYEARLNGKRVGRDLLTPGWTDYGKRVQYQTYDVSDLLNEGGNVIGAILGDGWYSGNIAWFGNRIYGNTPHLLMQVLQCVADRPQLLGLFVRNVDVELFLERHDQLDGIEAVRAEVLHEAGVLVQLVALNAEFLDDDVLDLLFELVHVGHG